MSFLSDLVSKVAPIIGGLLTGGPLGAGAVAIKMLASTFGTSPEPDKIVAAIKADPQAAVKLRQLELDNKVELQRLSLENETARIIAVNRTMRVEAAANDVYVRRWRPTIGYVVAGQMALLGVSAFVLVIGAMQAKDPAQAKALFDGLSSLISSLTAIMSVELAVLGVNIAKRSQDKAVSAGHAPAAGLLGALVGKLSG